MIESWIFFVVVSYTTPNTKQLEFTGRAFGPYTTQESCTVDRDTPFKHPGVEVVHVTQCIKVQISEKP